MKPTEIDALALETLESCFKSIDVGMERGARCIRVGCRPDPDRPCDPKKFGAIARAAKRQVKRLAAGWGLSGNCATVRADQKLEGLAEINRGPPALAARAGVQRATAPHHHPAPVVMESTPRFPFATKHQND